MFDEESRPCRFVGFGRVVQRGLGAGSVVDVEAVLIEGAMPPDVCQLLTEAVKQNYKRLDLTGLEEFRIEQSKVGRRARSIGAALLPIHSRYFLSA